ncbi:heterokaryon incompatibility protein-domain-containing protein [Colletotrichum godetiae]|uniref:Heterokaryon incompatibility protein-domain-containing protein n=1 Tax=Colletotrichum godetiae TaxID=1209918 RepID=A0AAJ0ADW1_9PEZI|nr:heterokaryon incompatibility protein-domain-containing protein [Colletotrichum godetiae]KAK1659902.1 heterokaryon incompatibility protein-domain-containing protein [Colletotrichum godetiae]
MDHAESSTRCAEPLSLRIPDYQPQYIRRLPKHLIPFLPYLNRPNTSHTLEERIPAGKHALRLSTMAFWLRTCASSHGDHCGPPPRPGASLPLWLIDVRAYRLVAVKDEDDDATASGLRYPYVALSYVWGQASSATATLANIAALQAPGALNGQEIPATIREAMNLTRLLGERYLWVDRLCIVQDDEDAKHAQLRGMADIYAGALLTIVAAQGRGADEPLHHGLVSETVVEGDEGDPNALPCLEEVSPEEWAQRLFEFIERTPRSPGRPTSPEPDYYNSPLFAGYGGSPRYTGCGSPYDSPSPMDIESPDFLPESPSYTEVDSPVVSEWILPPSPMIELPSVPQEHTNDPQLSPLEVPDTFSVTDAPNFRRQREADAHRIIMEGHARDLVNTVWCQRGWTFQELMFSRRQLVFHNDTVNWQCHCASWHENQRYITTGPCSGVGGDEKYDNNSNSKVNSNDNRVPDPSSSIKLLPGISPWPDLHRYARLVALYNKRVLTFDHDVHDAFAGVLSAFGQSFHGGFICGLPRIFFDAALLWQPYEPLVRRASHLTSALPSWSWMGWQGNLQSESWRSGYRYLRGLGSFWRPDPWQTRRTVVWSYSLAVNGERVPVGGDAAEFSDDRTSEGWCEKFCERAQKPYFLHSQTGAQKFWFPVPLASMANTPDGPPSRQPAYLHGLTRWGFLQISKLFYERRASQCLCATLCDLDGRWAGVLRLNVPSKDSAAHDGSSVGEMCELIEISAGSVESQPGADTGFDGWEEAECARHGGTYEFVNVLWIEWRDDVAYRKALGRVWETAWARVVAEDVQITLG